MPEKRVADAGDATGADHGVDVLAGGRDISQPTQTPGNHQADADLATALRTMRGDLVGRLVALHQVDGVVDHGLAGLSARIQGAIAAVEAEGGGDG